jgi:hypothetical protein
MKQDVPGNAMASEAAYLREMVRAGQELYGAEKTFDGLFTDEVELKAIKITFRGEEGPWYTAIVTAYVVGQDCVAFHSDDSLAKVVLGVLARLKNRSLKWKEDQYGGSHTGKSASGS